MTTTHGAKLTTEAALTGAETTDLTDGGETTLHTHAASGITSGTMATARLGSGTADATTFLAGDQTYKLPVVQGKNANDIFRVVAPGGTMLWTGTISGTPSGATVTVSAPTSGQEAALVPASTSQLAKLRLYNLTRGNYALISNYNTTTNVVTLTANAPANWANGDSLTITSQTVVGAFNWVDIELTDATYQNKSVLFLNFASFSATANDALRLHPFETWSSAKYDTISGAASVGGNNTAITKWISNCYSLSISGTWTGVNDQFAIRVAGYTP